VYKGWWQGEAVAVKTLKIDHDTPERRKALLREGAIYHSIVHPSLLRVYGAVDEDDMCALVMPLMEHGSLHSAFASKVPCLVSSFGARPSLCTRQPIASSLLRYYYSKNHSLAHWTVLLAGDLIINVKSFACALAAFCVGDGSSCAESN
jgi:serine/threonine protein kinase